MFTQWWLAICWNWREKDCPQVVGIQSLSDDQQFHSVFTVALLCVHGCTLVCSWLHSDAFTVVLWNGLWLDTDQWHGGQQHLGWWPQEFGKSLYGGGHLSKRLYGILTYDVYLASHYAFIDYSSHHLFYVPIGHTRVPNNNHWCTTSTETKYTYLVGQWSDFFSMSWLAI